MSQLQRGNTVGIAFPLGQNQNGGDDLLAGYFFATEGTISAIRTRLTALNGAIFTTAYLDRLSYNDLLFALVTLGG